MVSTTDLLLTLPKMTFCLWTKLFLYPCLLQLPVLAHFCQKNDKSSQICNLNGTQEIIRQENLISCPPATDCYVFSLYPMTGFLQTKKTLSMSFKTLPSINLLLHQSFSCILTMQGQSFSGSSLCIQVAPIQLASCTNGSGIKQTNRYSSQLAVLVTLSGQHIKKSRSLTVDGNYFWTIYFVSLWGVQSLLFAYQNSFLYLFSVSVPSFLYPFFSYISFIWCSWTDGNLNWK